MNYFSNKRIDWNHVGNILWCLDDMMGWYAIVLSLLVLITALSWVSGFIFVACVLFKIWAVNWERVKWM